jgi:hypothetical protein
MDMSISLSDYSPQLNGYINFQLLDGGGHLALSLSNNITLDGVQRYQFVTGMRTRDRFSIPIDSEALALEIENSIGHFALLLVFNLERVSRVHARAGLGIPHAVIVGRTMHAYIVNTRTGQIMSNHPRFIELGREHERLRAEEALRAEEQQAEEQRREAEAAEERRRLAEKEQIRQQEEFDRWASQESVVINGVRWAMRNVGTPGNFVANISDKGAHFHWANRRRMVVTGTNTRANNPCPPGWRVPTHQEFQSLGRCTPRIINGVYGCLYGIAPNKIFLPAAGFVRSENIWGVYATREYAMERWQFMLDRADRRGSFFIDREIGSDNRRIRGASVRCIADN